MARTITKLRFDGKKVGIRYEVARDGDDKPDLYRVQCGDPPLAAFGKALQALAPYVVDILELKPAWADGLTVRGLKLVWRDGELFGVVVTALKALKASDAPLVLNTPLVGVGGYIHNAVFDLLQRAGDYLDGKRAQGRLFEEEAVVLESDRSGKAVTITRKTGAKLKRLAKSKTEEVAA